MAMTVTNVIVEANIIKRARKLGIDISAPTFQKYLPYLMMVGYFCETFNTEFKRRGIPITLSMDDLIRMSAIGTFFHYNPVITKYVVDGNAPGVVFEQQIITAASVMSNIISGIETGDETKCFNHVPAPMQWGKTGMLSSLALMGPILHLLTGDVFSIVQFLPPMNALERQSQAAVAGFLELYGSVDISYNGRSTSMREYNTHTLVEFRSDFLGVENPLSPQGDELVVTSKGLAELNKNLTSAEMRRTNSTLAKLDVLFNAFDNSKRKIIFLFDEIHYASTARGKKDALQSSVQENILTLLMERFSDRISHPIVSCSATAFPMHNLSAVEMVPPHIPEGYCGLDFINGVKITDKVIPSPTCCTVDDIAASSGVKHFDQIHGHLYNATEQNFCKKASDYGIKCMQSTYRKRCHKALVEYLNYALYQDKDINGAIIRLNKRNSDSDSSADALIEDFRKYNPQFKVIKYYMKHVEGTIKQEIASTMEPGQKYVIVVTASARMGDDLPNDCLIGLDFTTFSATQSSLNQGIYGRLCGYGKNKAIVVLSKDNLLGKENRAGVRRGGLQAWLDSDGADTNRKLCAGSQSSLPAVKNYIDFDPNDPLIRNNPILMTAMDGIQDMVSDLFNEGSIRFKNNKLQNKSGDTEFFRKHFTRRTAKEFESNHIAFGFSEPVELLTPGKTTETTGLECNDGKIGTRTKLGGSKTDSRYRHRVCTEDQLSRGTPSVHITKDGSVALIRMLLVKPQIISDGSKANQRSMFTRLSIATNEETHDGY